MTIYYSTDVSKIDITKTEVSVEVYARGMSNGGEVNKYNARFSGERATLQAIEFLNSVKGLVGKDRILDITLETSTYEYESE